MANYKRSVVGSIVKHKKAKDADYDPLKHPDYIQLPKDVVLKKGYLNLESKAYQLRGIEDAVARGVMTAENGEKAKERISQIPDFVRFQIVSVEKNNS